MGEERDLSPPSNKKKHGSTNKPEEIAEPDDGEVSSSVCND
jgi:hypothetical protein